MWHYARGLAHCGAQGRSCGGGGAGEGPRRGVAHVKDDVIIILNPAPALLKLAAEVLAGDIAARQQRFDEAVAHLQDRDRDGRRAHLRRAAALVSLRAQSSRRDAARSRTPGGSGRRVPRRPALREGDRVVAVGAGAGASRRRATPRDAAEAGRRFKAAWKYADVPASIATISKGMNRPGGTR